MLSMPVTLDVSRLSGWLNALVLCQFEREGMQRNARAGREARGREAMACRREDPSIEIVGLRIRGAHGEHAAHGYDAGRVETERLVERRR